MANYRLTEAEVGARLSAALDRQEIEPEEALRMLGQLGIDLREFKPFEVLGWPTLYTAHVGLFSAQLLWTTRGKSEEVLTLLDMSEALYDSLGDRGGSANCADLRQRMAASGAQGRGDARGYCTKCGGALAADARFCQFCGQRL